MIGMPPSRRRSATGNTSPSAKVMSKIAQSGNCRSRRASAPLTEPHGRSAINPASNTVSSRSRATKGASSTISTSMVIKLCLPSQGMNPATAVRFQTIVRKASSGSLRAPRIQPCHAIAPEIGRGNKPPRLAHAKRPGRDGTGDATRGLWRDPDLAEARHCYIPVTESEMIEPVTHDYEWHVA